jgi:mevalonate kinase
LYEFSVVSNLIFHRESFFISQGCAAKLTGAGGGGCAFAVLDERKDANMQKLQLVRSCQQNFCRPAVYRR